MHLVVLNTGSFGHSLTGKKLGLNVVRAPAYSSFNLDPDDERANARFIPRQEPGGARAVVAGDGGRPL